MRILDDRSWMLFVDGENFAKRGEQVLGEAGVSLETGPAWEKDVFLWTPHGRAQWYGIHGSRTKTGDLVRAFYYTSKPGEAWNETRLHLRELGFEPKVFPRRKGKSKAVDIALATDVLTMAAAGHYDAAVIVSGDGDFVPVIESVKSLGLHIGVASLASSTSDELRIAADEYVDLTADLVSDWADVPVRRAEAAEQEFVEKLMNGDQK